MAEDTVKQLKDDGSGRWDVVTISGSRYQVDLDARTLTRLPFRVDNRLRKDAGAVRLVGLVECKVGSEAIFVLAGVSDDPDVVTTRRTSEVILIAPSTEPSFRDRILADPTRCYADGCDKENEILLHLSDDPWGGADLCWEHARVAFQSCVVPHICDCPFCERARQALSDGQCPSGADDGSDESTAVDSGD